MAFSLGTGVDEAIATIQSALTLLPDHYAPHLNYGIALVRKEDYAGSLPELRARHGQEDLEELFFSLVSPLVLRRGFLMLAIRASDAETSR